MKHDAHNPHDSCNDLKYRTGKICVEDGCNRPAGTAWSPYWCLQHNAERLDRITKQITAFIKDGETVCEHGSRPFGCKLCYPKTSLDKS